VEDGLGSDGVYESPDEGYHPPRRRFNLVGSMQAAVKRVVTKHEKLFWTIFKLVILGLYFAFFGSVLTVAVNSVY
jgi:hypothetical protein